jgi:3-oxocholest-4-en-26-oate---CoA ligase
VVGVPNLRVGQSIVAVVEPAKGRNIDAGALIGHVKSSLAAYKAPREIILVDEISRGPNGKPDLPTIRQLAVTQASKH